MRTVVKQDGKTPAKEDLVWRWARLCHELNRYDHPRQGRKRGKRLSVKTRSGGDKKP